MKKDNGTTKKRPTKTSTAGTTEGPSQLVDRLLDRYNRKRGMLIPIMQDIQEECQYLPVDVLKELSLRMEVPLSQIFSVATFYAMFRLAPPGEHQITLCMGTVCFLKGAGKVAEAIQREFSVEAGGTSPDRKFTFKPVNCVGACALAPVMIVDGTYYDAVTPESAIDILHDVAGGKKSAHDASSEGE
ncbi:MAG: NAD(P)H-dependent oxidoreductase subunit E [bacterium]